MPDGSSIHAGDLIPMDLFCRTEALLIDLVYADASHPENIFGIAAYRKEARLILHKDLARVIIAVSRRVQKDHGWTLVLKDGLRTIEAQEMLINTDIVRQNPHWLGEPRLLSGPGQGAHPLGMAIDVSVLDAAGQPVDMGTFFDAMVPESARAYDGFPPEVLAHRRILEDAFTGTAAALSLPMLPLPSEWWDFRFPASHTAPFAPLSDNDLPVSLKMCGAGGPAHPEPDFERLAKDIVLSI